MYKLTIKESIDWMSECHNLQPGIKMLSICESTYRVSGRFNTINNSSSVIFSDTSIDLPLFWDIYRFYQFPNTSSSACFLTTAKQASISTFFSNHHHTRPLFKNRGDHEWNPCLLCGRQSFFHRAIGLVNNNIAKAFSYD